MVRSDGIEYLMPLKELKQLLNDNQISWVTDESGDWDGNEMLKTRAVWCLLFRDAQRREGRRWSWTEAVDAIRRWVVANITIP